MKTRLIVLTAMIVLLTGGASAGGDQHIRAILVPQAGSSVHGVVNLTQEPHGGTLITVVAKGLRPDGAYLSLYYDNDHCEIEAYAEDDVIGSYTGNSAGVAVVTAKQGDDLDEIGSVSVRNAADFSLLACAKVHAAP